MRSKKVFDGRTLPRQAKAQLRVAAVRRVEAGESPEAVVAGMGLNRRSIYRWLTAYHYGGEAALAAKPIPGAPPKLSPRQMARLARIVHTRNPQQLNFEFALWTLAMIRQLIQRRFGVSLSEVSVGRLMRRLGFSPQRPLYRAWQQDPVLVERWRTEDYPRIAARAKQEGALIFFADESGIRSDHHAGTTWAPVGRTPVVKATGARHGLNMLSAVTALGHFRFMVVEGRVTATVFCDFLKRLITGIDRKIFLIVDGHPVHKAKLVSRFVAERAEVIELFFLPPYAPELNPDELAWGHLKTRIGKAATWTKEELKRATERALHRLQKLPEIVASFFHTPSCAYAKL